MNILVSLHGVAHNLYKVTADEYFIKVPNGIKVYMFAPTNHCIYSNEYSEEMIKRFLQNPNWTCSPECNKGGLFEHTQLYLPGDEIINLMLDSDIPEYYGVFIMSNPIKRMNIEINSEKKETTYDIERLLKTIAPKKTKQLISVFLCICSPHSISPHEGSILKWKGKHNPSRKATKKYDSFVMDDNMIQKAKIIQEKRIKLEQLGKKRFKISAHNGMFTRSMSFPLNMRNGSFDHIPPNIGKGIFETPTPFINRGMYFKVDKQDYEVNLLYEKNTKN